MISKIKILRVLFFGTVIIFTLSFFPKPEDEISHLIKSILWNYELLYKSKSSNTDENFFPSYRDDNPYLPLGIRGNYTLLESIASLKTWQQSIYGVNVFVSGPHNYDGLNFNSKTDFGHYNPNFLNMVYNQLDSLLMDENFRIGVGVLYNRRFKRMVRTYYEASIILKSNDSLLTINTGPSIKDLKVHYLKVIAIGEPFIGIPNNPISDQFLDILNNQGYNEYDISTALDFWIRRNIDGTDDEFIRLLTLVLGKIDPEFLKETDIRWYTKK